MGQPPVVLVPGMLCDADLWSDVRTRLAAPTVDAVIDAPTIRGMAEQVLSCVPGKFVLAGLSLGAIVGFEVLRLAPDKVAGFCALSTNAAAPTKTQKQQWTDLARRTQAGDFAGVVATSILPHMFATATPPTQLQQRFLAMADRVGPEVFVAQLAAQHTRRSAFAALTQARCPTLVISADADRLCPPTYHHSIAASVEYSCFASLPGAGHLSTWERPNDIAALIHDWLPATTTQELTCQKF